MKISVGPTNNVTFQQPTDRGRSAQITVSGGGGSAVASEAYNQANAAYGAANSAANNVRVSANSGSTIHKANGLNFVNSPSIIVTVESNPDGNANVSFVTSAGAVGDVYQQANSARDQANTAYAQANAAYGEANLKLDIAGGTITGNLTISGNLEVLGNSTVLNVETLVVEDNEIILNGNVNSAPTFDAFITINRGTSPNVALKWNEDLNRWEWTDDGTNYFSLDTALNSYAQSNTAYAQANDAYLQANTARDQANAGYLQANTARGTANDSYAQANIARDQANTARVTANDAYLQANVARTTANDAYGSANSAGLNALFAYGQANTARDTANNAYGAANNRVLKSGDTMTGTLNINFTGVGLNVNTQSEFANNVTIKNPLTGSANLTVIGNANVTNTVTTNTVNFGSNIYDFTSNTFQTTSNDLIEVDSFSAALFSTVKYIVQVKTGVNLHSTELFCIQDGVSTYLTEYATLISGAPLGTFSINLSGGRMILNFSPDNPLNNILTFKVVRNTIST